MGTGYKVVLALAGLGVAGTIGLPALGIGQDRTDQAHGRAGHDSSLDRRVTAHFEHAGAEEVLAWLRQEGFNFVVKDASVSDQKITLSVENQPLWDVAQSIASALGGGWSREGDVYTFHKGMDYMFDGLSMPLSDGKGIPFAEGKPFMFTAPGGKGFNFDGMGSKDWSQFGKQWAEWGKKFGEQFGKDGGTNWSFTVPDLPQEPQTEYDKNAPEWKAYKEKMRAWAKKFSEQFKNWNPNFGKDGKTFVIPPLPPMPKMNGDLKGYYYVTPDSSGPEIHTFRVKPGGNWIEDDSGAKGEGGQRVRVYGDDGSGARAWVGNDGDMRLEGSGGVNSDQVKRALKTLSAAQREKMSSRGYLTPSDLTAEQRTILNGMPTRGHWSMSFDVDGQRFDLRSN